MVKIFATVAALLLAFGSTVEGVRRLASRTSGGTTHWTCLQSPSNYNNSIYVGALGPNNTAIGCMGPSPSQCIWFEGPGCSRPLSPIEGFIGRMCPSCPHCLAQTGWCKEAADFLATNPTPSIHTCSATATATLFSNQTVTATTTVFNETTTATTTVFNETTLTSFATETVNQTLTSFATETVNQTLTSFATETVNQTLTSFETLTETETQTETQTETFFETETMTETETVTETVTPSDTSTTTTSDTTTTNPV